MGNFETTYYNDEEKEIAPETNEGSENTTVKDGTLLVKKLDLCIPENTRDHHTDKYDCTSTREDKGFGTDARLVVRRGQPFTIKVYFDRPFSLEKDDMKIIFKTGHRPELYVSTQGQCEVDESGKVKFGAFEWGATLVDKSGQTATIKINVPADCAIGRWSLSISTISKVQGERRPVKYEYQCRQKIIMLFNPWCKDDQVYMEEDTGREEYVLLDQGAVFRGHSHYAKGKPWNFAQFEDGKLDISIDLIEKFCQKRGKKINHHRLADPIDVSRNIAQAVNGNDWDNGVLIGRWDGKYKDGENPSNWFGSARIMDEYHRSKAPVKYGQCWVFSGVTTTVCRAVGLCALSVTNYDSAHDSNENHVIEKYLTKNPETGRLENESGDSVWNYHVWNQVWMRRPDVDTKGKYDGWQAIDATPQERSCGVFTCGPAPLLAIKEGRVSVQYDTGFVFSEVNADEVIMEKKNGQFQLMEIRQDRIGSNICTKVPDGKPFKSRIWGKTHQEVTDQYKYPEGKSKSRIICKTSSYYIKGLELNHSRKREIKAVLVRIPVEHQTLVFHRDPYKDRFCTWYKKSRQKLFVFCSDDNRNAVMRAVSKAVNISKFYTGKSGHEDVEFHLNHEKLLILGKHVDVKLTAENKSTNRRTLHLVQFSVHALTNEGVLGKVIKIDDKNIDENLVPGTVYEYTTRIEVGDYFPCIDDVRCMCIQVYAEVEGTRTRPVQSYYNRHDTAFTEPDLEVTMPEKVEKGQEFVAEFVLENPLKEELTECTAGYEGRGFKHVTGETQDNVPSEGKARIRFTLKATRVGHFNLVFKFTSKQLHFLSGSGEVTVI